jgi:hypothetical protein
MLTTPQEFHDRLRSVFCRHRGIMYDEYDARVASESLTIQEVRELLDVLFGEIQNAGLYDILFADEAEEHRRKKERLAEIEKSLHRIGLLGAAGRERYAIQFEQLRAEAKELRASL